MSFFLTQAFQSSNILNDFKMIAKCKIPFKKMNPQLIVAGSNVTQAFQSSNILNDFKIILECKISFKNKTHNI